METGLERAEALSQVRSLSVGPEGKDNLSVCGGP